jgi:hypothetical protein
MRNAGKCLIAEGIFLHFETCANGKYVGVESVRNVYRCIKDTSEASRQELKKSVLFVPKRKIIFYITLKNKEINQRSQQTS